MFSDRYISHVTFSVFPSVESTVTSRLATTEERSPVSDVTSYIIVVQETPSVNLILTSVSG